MSGGCCRLQSRSFLGIKRLSQESREQEGTQQDGVFKADPGTCSMPVSEHVQQSLKALRMYETPKHGARSGTSRDACCESVYLVGFASSNPPLQGRHYPVSLVNATQSWPPGRKPRKRDSTKELTTEKKNTCLDILFGSQSVKKPHKLTNIHRKNDTTRHDTPFVWFRLSIRSRRPTRPRAYGFRLRPHKLAISSNIKSL